MTTETKAPNALRTVFALIVPVTRSTSVPSSQWSSSSPNPEEVGIRKDTSLPPRSSPETLVGSTASSSSGSESTILSWSSSQIRGVVLSPLR